MNKFLARIVALALIPALIHEPLRAAVYSFPTAPVVTSTVASRFQEQALSAAVLSDEHVAQNFLHKFRTVVSHFRSPRFAGPSVPGNREIGFGIRERLVFVWLDITGIFFSPVPKPRQLAVRRALQVVLIAGAAWSSGPVVHGILVHGFMHGIATNHLAGIGWAIPFVAPWIVPGGNLSTSHALKELISLNTRIERLERQSAQTLTLSQLQKRRNHFSRFIKSDLTRFSGDLRSELPGQMEMWHKVADTIGPWVYAEENGLPKRILRRLDQANAWPAVLKNTELTKSIFREKIVFDNPAWEQRWWIRAIPESLRRSGGDRIAYFSAEFGIWQLGIYGGGLGILAGDFLRIAGKLGMNFTGVSLWYPRGYFKQGLNNGVQYDDRSQPNNNPADLPLERVQVQDAVSGQNKDLLIDIPIPGLETPIKAKAWRAHYGKAELLLVDVDIPENEGRWVGSTPVRLLCERLYDNNGGTRERMLQYYILGVGGAEVLRVTGKTPRILHTNDCHPLFAPVMSIVQAMSASTAGKSEPDLKLAFEEALDQVRAKTIFTTHTPVEAGNEKANRLDELKDLMRILFRDRFKNEDLADYAANRLTGLGMLDGQFNMAAFLMRLARRRNGVSQLHGAVSRRMWERLFPGVPESETPISGIVNGVEPEYWMTQRWRTLFTPVFNRLGDLMAKPENLRARLLEPGWIDRHIPLDNRVLATARRQAKVKLFEMIRERIPKGDPMVSDALTFGFARRGARYKRAHLLFTDRPRLAEQIRKAKGPVQFVFAGKAHLMDEGGRDLIKQVHDNILALKRELGDKVRIVYVPEYDVRLAMLLEGAVDVWLNTPERPQEASGTSGEKVGTNGGLNLSVLDGWFDEGYIPGVNGWPVSEPLEKPWNDLEAASLYNTLGTVIDTYDNHPETWWRMVKGTTVWTASQYGMGRMMAEYAQTLYGPMIREDRPVDTRARLRKQENLKAHWEALPQAVHLEPCPLSATVGRPVHISVLFTPPPGVSLEDVGFDLAIGQANQPMRYWGMNQNVESLGDGRYRLTAQVTLPQAGSYHYTVRISPIDQVGWAWDDHEHKPTYALYVSEDHPIEAVDLELMAARAQLPEPGLMYYLKIPMPVQNIVRRVRVARGPEWNENNTADLRHLRGEIFGAVIPAWAGEFQFHYYLDLKGWGKPPWPLNVEQLSSLPAREDVPGIKNHLASTGNFGARMSYDWTLNVELARRQLRTIQSRNTTELLSRIEAFSQARGPVRERLLRGEIENLDREAAGLQFGAENIPAIRNALESHGNDPPKAHLSYFYLKKSA